MNHKITSKQRRATKGRAIIKRLKTPRLNIHRTPRHMRAQIILANGTVVASASSVGKEFQKLSKKTGNVVAAAMIGKLIAERAKKAGIIKVAFDRSGFKYHGRVKALADAAREGGLDF